MVNHHRHMWHQDSIRLGNIKKARTHLAGMDFDPDGAKWQCCCCNLPQGLKILAVFEVICTALGFVFVILRGYNEALTEGFGAISWFEIFLALELIFLSVTSFLLLLGIQRHKYRLMYPSLVARTALVAFVQVFGVSKVVAPPEVHIVETTTVMNENGNWRSKTAIEEHPHSEPNNVAIRLLLLVFIMIFVSVAVFYSIYLVVRGIRYVHAYARLERRRNSVILAGQIDPEMCSRRPSANSSAGLN